MTIASLYDIFLRFPSIQTDTRKLKQGDLYFALKGASFNGNHFAVQALEMGAAYAIIDEVPKGDDMPPPYHSERLLLVDDVLTTLQELALHHRKQFNIPFIAITGSNGKTTTKELIHAVLASTYITYTTVGNLNNHIGIPLTLLSVKKDAQFAVIEMGANHQKEIESYCLYTLPTHGIITNAGKAHLEGFGGPEGVKKGKGELYDFLRSNKVPSSNGGAAFVMWDYDYLQTMSKGIPHIIRYGTKDADIVGRIPESVSPEPNSSYDPDGSRRSASFAFASGSADRDATFLHVDITHGAPIGAIQTQLVGDYNLPNVLAAVAVGLHFGVAPDAIRTAIEAYTPSNSRSQMIIKDGNHIILDAYNANPSSMRAAIDNFARLPLSPFTISNPTGDHAAVTPQPSDRRHDFSRKLLILGAMAELGEESLAEHEGIVKLIGEYPWAEVVLVGGDFQKIKHPYHRFDNSKEAAQWLKNARIKDAYLLIKGSRSTKMEEVLTP